MVKLGHTKRRTITAATAVIALGLLSFGGAASVARADTTGPTTFEGFTIGSVNGQDGWLSGIAYDNVPFDQAVTEPQIQYPGFGARSLRISNAVTSGAFGNQTFSKPVLNPAGESTPQKHFDSTFQVGTAVAEAQRGLFMSVSPDDGTGGRMSWLGFEDKSDGIHVEFSDAADTGPVYKEADFKYTEVANFAYGTAHTIRFSIDFFAGPANDVVKIYIDGALKVTGTTWEDYYRYDNEQKPPITTPVGVEPPAVSKLEFREGGTPVPANSGKGFLVDNVTLASSGPTSACNFDVTATSMTLTADCTTDQTILVPNGKTLDGNGHSITAVDPAGGHFLGAVVANAGTVANVKNLTVTASNLATTGCDAFPASLAGIRLDGASGSISDNTVTAIQQGANGDGCQEGNAIEVRNTPVEGVPQVGTPQVAVTGNVVSDYQKTGVLVKGQVAGIVTGNTVTGYGPVGFIAQNGIQVSAAATAQVTGNAISDNFYAPEAWDACGLIIYDAGGVKLGKNTFSGNEKNLCNVGRGGGKFGGV